ncbi:hypothetical protein AURDEDRAFT_131192 [Auricularia subglabra TFB-10046 SS5]|uniref:Uncharacterized protein n=1 Tax=Auricularia subglabra (strain TFB-10046 / SS5) TaxID=717982 RepID=J0WPM7_AURST|nr:hypothetical protein AURDEDRAFT_131192 [Auricularia subglabra TFB-10046 SS5]
MAPTPLELAFADIAKSPFNLLQKNVDAFLAGLRPHWIDWESNGRKAKASDKSKAVVYYDNAPAIIPLMGVLDAEKSQIGHYGNLWMPSGGRNFTPEFSDLVKARFVVHITYPRGDNVNVDDVLIKTTANEVLTMNKVQAAVNAAMVKDNTLQNVDDDKISDWVDFEKGPGGLTGSIKANLGNVYMTAVQKVKGKDVTELSPSKNAADPSAAIRCDDLHLFAKGRIPKSNTLQRIDSLPVFLPDGKSAGARDADDLSVLLYGGRWVRMDVRMIVWNINGSKGPTRAFTLEVVKLQLFPPVLSTNTVFLKPNSLTETDGYVPQELVNAIKKDGTVNKDKLSATVEGKAGEASHGDKIGDDKSLETANVDGDDKGEDDDTVSESSKGGVKRTASEAGLQSEEPARRRKL